MIQFVNGAGQDTTLYVVSAVVAFIYLCFEYRHERRVRLGSIFPTVEAPCLHDDSQE